jgi:DNA polymerase-3 subunit epsilon
MGALEELSKVVRRNNFVVLDTETTGLDMSAQCCQLAVIGPDGTVLIDTLVKPTIPIPADATAIHGITNAMVADAPGMEIIGAQLLDVLRNRDLIIYNADYDLRVLAHSIEMASMNGETGARWDACLCDDPNEVLCAMRIYAAYWGEWNKYHSSYTWQSLTAACRQQSLPIVDMHRALGDCKMTLALIRKICAQSLPERPIIEL